MAAESSTTDNPAELAALQGPDVMNDPRYVTNKEGGDDGMEDADTCRICRGEATEQEPLFYPCKCSGSIKFVHQDCLMEWLSHSQKKHCELCKTPFRFTKLYSPNMPQNLPTHVFVRRLTVHAIQNLTIWLRFCLVVFVWLGCLPWAMRHIWGFLFWFGDGGWSSKGVSRISSLNGTEASRALQILAGARGQVIDILNGTSPVSSPISRPTTPATFAGFLPAILQPLMEGFNLSREELTTGGIFKFLYPALAHSLSEDPIKGTNPLSPTGVPPTSSSGDSSLLSDVRFLKGLTRNQRINNIVITALEGQIITILVVVCFVLVFLIREWVVQQQPGINMGAGFNAEFAGGDRVARNRNVLPDNILDAEEPAAGEPRLFENLEDVAQRRAADVAARPIARPRRRVVRFEDLQGNDPPPVNDDREASIAAALPTRETQDPSEGTTTGQHQQRPGTLPRDALSPAADIQRQLAEDSSKLLDGFEAGEFVSVWRRAGGSPEEVLRIIEAEGLGKKWQYWKNAMETLQANSAQASSFDEPRSSNNPASVNSSLDSLAAQQSEGTDSTTESWEDIPSPPKTENPFGSLTYKETENSESTQSIKGKEKVMETLTEPLSDTSNNKGGLSVRTSLHKPIFDNEVSQAKTVDTFEGLSFQSSPGRPRAVSDGPQLRDSISPLAESYWSFSNLPGSSPTASTPGSTSSPSLDEFWRDGLHRRILGDADTVSIGQVSRGTAEITEYSPVSHSDEGHVEIYNHDDNHTRVARSWDEVFENNPVAGSDDGLDDNLTRGADTEQDAPQPDNRLPEDVPQVENREPAPPRRQPPEGILGHIANFLWGDMNPPPDGPAGDDEHIVQDLAAEAPFVPVANHHGHAGLGGDERDDEGGMNQDRDVLAAALAAGIDPNDPNDPDGLDDIEDFEGIMELVGMRGPLAALVQNGLFSAVLISLTVACGVWMPYNVGRLALLLAANPVATVKLPLKFLFSFAAVLQDMAAVALGSVTFLVIKLCSLPRFLLSYAVAGPISTTTSGNSGPALESLRFARTAGERIINGFIIMLMRIPDSEIPAFSAVSHESLLLIKELILNSLRYTGSLITAALVYPGTGTISAHNALLNIPALRATVSNIILRAGHILQAMPTLLVSTEPWVISLDLPERTVPLDLSLSYWNGTDRFWAILAGYIAFCFLGAAYLWKGTPFSTSHTGREWEATIIDVLNQAGGVMKVILIISIEMLVFPLYCGLLLDIALLPLFENATVLSRVIFTIESPLTSIFVHWFVGTCYMFHFALFVSMCRKIMRSGVLYFIRDPDDPTFHPVRDVLERNVTTQLRKITFSAMVYGALVVVCLGGVVWGLASAFKGVLPIHWSSNEPVLEFPIDLLFYNFFMPLAVKFFKPSDGLHAMYTWWFRKCARMLRLTWFLFDDRMLNEEGHHVRRGWIDTFQGAQGDVTNPVETGHLGNPFEEDPDLRAYFQRDGRYARVPASDQVRIPKGGQVFVDVDDNNKRIDGLQDADDGLHGRTSAHFQMVHVPPRFRGRVFLFILSIWIFAAVTGVSITIIPLVVGRQIFAAIIPPYVRKNDIYAFSIGIYVLGSAVYCLLHLHRGLDYIRSALTIDADTTTKVLRKLSGLGLRVLRVIYAYSAFALVLPSLFAFVVEFYFIVPLHTYFAVSEPHVIHFVQSWTLGLLYLKLTTRFILWHAESRPAEALRAITRRGYLDPDVKVATRAFIFPATTILVAALVIPFYLASVINRHGIFGHGPEQQMLVFRYAYPLCLSMMINAIGFWLLLGIMKGWRMRIRDEVYLIGERLHNFGDRNKSGTATLMPTGTRLET